MFFIVGSQISDENPVTDYLLRLTSIVTRKSVVIASPRAMKLDRCATRRLETRPARRGLS